MPKKGAKIKYYTKEEDAFIRQNVGKLTYVEIGDALGRSRDAVQLRARKLGVSANTDLKTAMIELPREAFKSMMAVNSDDLLSRRKAYLENGNLLSVERELADMKAIRDMSLEWMDGYSMTPDTMRFFVSQTEKVVKMAKEVAQMMKMDLPTRDELAYMMEEIQRIILEYVPESQQGECATKIRRAFGSSGSIQLFG
jgi:hypothetical protein